MKTNYLLVFFQRFILGKKKYKLSQIETLFSFQAYFSTHSPLLKIRFIKTHFSPGFAQGKGC